MWILGFFLIGRIICNRALHITLKAQDLVETEFDEEVWNLLVYKVLVGMAGRSSNLGMGYINT
ncbi:MAG: hypothetical protein ACYCYM_08030 [Saccharofermentanales bacterium]